MPTPFRQSPRAPRTIAGDHFELPLDDGRTITVACARHPRARRLKLSVDERGARLTLPPRASMASGRRFMLEHRDWLATQLQRHALDAVPVLRPGLTTTLPLRGADLPLRWQDGRYTRLHQDSDDNALCFSVPARAGQPALRRALRDFYESQARADVGRWLPRYLADLPRAPRRLRFKVMSSQWGSLAPDGAMTLDLALLLARPAAFEYVLVHELCHLLHHNHSRAFWREVERRFPAWRDERDYFHARGRQLKATLRALLTD